MTSIKRRGLNRLLVSSANISKAIFLHLFELNSSECKLSFWNGASFNRIHLPRRIGNRIEVCVSRGRSTVDDTCDSWTLHKYCIYVFWKITDVSRGRCSLSRPRSPSSKYQRGIKTGWGIRKRERGKNERAKNEEKWPLVVPLSVSPCWCIKDENALLHNRLGDPAPYFSPSFPPRPGGVVIA